MAARKIFRTALRKTIEFTVPANVGTVFLIFHFTFKAKYDILFIYVKILVVTMKLIFEIDAFSPDETSGAGARLANEILNNPSLPKFIALRGDLGAGKTEFTRGFASVASPGSFVKSPTYALVNEYKKGKIPLFHFDIYRLADEDDLYSTGYFDYLERGICLVEWFQNIPECLPDEYFEVVIDKINDGEARHISVYLNN